MVVDDLNHLRSMRHFWFSLSEFQPDILVAFLWLKTDPEKSRERNKSRANPVPESSFNKITTMFDPPGSSYFEENLILVDDSSSFDIDLIAQARFCRIEYKRQIVMKQSQSERHALDQLLRKEIGKVMARAGKGEKTELYKKLAAIKSDLMNTVWTNEMSPLDEFHSKIARL